MLYKIINKGYINLNIGLLLFYMVSIQERIKKENIQPGIPLEVILFKNAEYDRGADDKGWDIRGYHLPLTVDISEKEGIKILGYFVDLFKKRGTTMSFIKDGIILEDNLGKLYIDERVIHSYNKLKIE